MTVDSTRPTTVVGIQGWERLLMWVGFPVVGVGLGWLVRRLAEWALSLPWTPLEGPFKLISSLPEPYVTIGVMVVGAVAGIVLALIGHAETLIVGVSDETVTLTLDKKSREIAATAVKAAFVDHKHLVLLGHDDGELARDKTDRPTKLLRSAFEAHGYTWLDADPHADDFRPWVEGTTELSANEHALLKARRHAVEKDRKADAAELRDELAKLGVVVRDMEKRQQWRRTP